MNIDWDALVSSGLGALIGSALTLLATYWAHHLQRSQQEEKDQQMLLGILQAIHDEIETLWDIYIDAIGHQLEALADGQPLQMYWPVIQEYFTVYNTNAFFIGRIQNHDLRKLIVSTYSKSRGLIDSYRLNNDLVQKHEHAYWFFQETQNQIHKKNAESHFVALVNSAKALKESHAGVKKQVQELKRALLKEGIFTKR